MSNALAIAAVTSSIRYVLDRSLQQPHVGPVGGALVTTLRPDELTTSDLAGTAGINVYCYLATPNHAWNLTDLPTRRSDGSALQRPLAALDLHYLITCYGADEALEPQRLLGRAVGALSATSVLGRDVVTAAIEVYQTDTETSFLVDSDLAGEVELVKLAPVPLSLEEMSKLWGVLDTPYQLSLTYLATVVLVSADVTPTVALPVRTRSIAVRPTGAAHLAEVATDPPDQATTTGATLVLRGSRLTAPLGSQTLVRVAGTLLTPADGAGPAELRVTLTADVAAGVHGVQVVHRSPAGAGGDPAARTLASSNAVPVVVRPTVSVDAVSATEITLGVDPPIQPRQRVAVLLRRLSAPVDGEPDDVTVVLSPVAAGDPPVPALTVSREGVPAGDWLVRLQVDGIESLPEASGDTFDQPAVTLPAPP
jgi:hypothetical protein